VAIPIMPGRFERWRQMVDTLRERADEHEASMRERGLLGEPGLAPADTAR
jgi:hypothetical protein